MNSADPTHPDKTIGDILRETRESLGMSQETLASETKLKLDIINALENNSFENLPALPYIKAFLVTICKRLGLNTKSLIEKLTSQRGIPVEEPLPLDKKETLSINNRPQKIFPLLILVALGIVLLVMLLKLQKKSIPSGAQFKEESAPSDTLPGLTEMQSSPQGSLDSGSIKDSTSVQIDTTLQKMVTKVPEKKPESTTNSPAKPARSSSNYIIFKCIKDSVWINVKRNGRKNLNKKLNKNTTWTVSKTDSMVVTVGVPGSIEFNLNGKSYLPKMSRFKIIGGKYQSK